MCAGRRNGYRLVPRWFWKRAHQSSLTPVTPPPLLVPSESRPRPRSSASVVEAMLPAPPRPVECASLASCERYSSCSLSSRAWTSASFFRSKGSREGDRTLPAPPRPLEIMWPGTAAAATVSRGIALPERSRDREGERMICIIGSKRIDAGEEKAIYSISRQ